MLVKLPKYTGTKNKSDPSYYINKKGQVDIHLSSLDSHIVRTVDGKKQIKASKSTVHILGHVCMIAKKLKDEKAIAILSDEEKGYPKWRGHNTRKAKMPLNYYKKSLLNAVEKRYLRETKIKLYILRVVKPGDKNAMQIRIREKEVERLKLNLKTDWSPYIQTKEDREGLKQSIAHWKAQVKKLQAEIKELKKGDT